MWLFWVVISGFDRLCRVVLKISVKNCRANQKFCLNKPILIELFCVKVKLFTEMKFSMQFCRYKRLSTESLLSLDCGFAIKKWLIFISFLVFGLNFMDLSLHKSVCMFMDVDFLLLMSYCLIYYELYCYTLPW